MTAGEDRPGEDPFDGLVLDDAFVSAAAMQEASAEERTRRPSPRVPARPPRRRRARSALGRAVSGPWTARRAVATMALVLVLFVGLAVARDRAVAEPVPGTFTIDSGGVQVASGTSRPTPTDGASAPLGRPPETDPDGAWEPLDTTEGGAVRWDPCREIHYVTDERSAPGGTDRVVAEAVAEVEAATGLTFVDDGDTTEPLTRDRAPFQPDRYGDAWAPVLISWTAVAAVFGDPLAVGVASPVASEGDDGRLAFVSGAIALDPVGLTAIAQELGVDQVRAVVVHELGHLVGLDHVGDEDELMYPETGHRSELGAGDRAGLAEMGRGPCVSGL